MGQILWRTEVDPEQSVEDSTKKIEKKSNEKHRADALAPGSDEGRGKLR